MNLLIVDDEILAIQGLVDDMDWKKLDFDEVFTANSYAQAVILRCLFGVVWNWFAGPRSENRSWNVFFSPVMQSFPLQNRPFRWAVWIIS